jgi:chromosome segregation ATPase
MFSQSAAYTDTAKTVRDAQAIRDHAKKRLTRAQTMLDQQVRQRQQESRRTEVLLQERVRVVRELHTPGQVAAVKTMQSVEGSILELASASIDLEHSVQVAQGVRDDLVATIAEHEAALAGHRASKERSLAQLEHAVASINEATARMEHELGRLAREEKQLEEQNKFFEAQIFIKAAPPEIAVQPLPLTPVTLNGYVIVAEGT